MQIILFSAQTIQDLFKKNLKLLSKCPCMNTKIFKVVQKDVTL